MSLESLEKRIRVLEDIEEIKKLKHRYCALCDANYNADALAELFTEDAVWDGQERGRNDGREARHRAAAQVVAIGKAAGHAYNIDEPPALRHPYGAEPCD